MHINRLFFFLSILSVMERKKTGKDSFKEIKEKNTVKQTKYMLVFVR